MCARLAPVGIKCTQDTQNLDDLSPNSLLCLRPQDPAQDLQELRIVDEGGHDVAGTRADLAQRVQRRITLRERRVGEPDHDDLHELRDVRQNLLSPNTSELPQAHEDVRGHDRIGVVRLREEHLQHWDRVGLDKPVGRANQ